MEDGVQGVDETLIGHSCLAPVWISATITGTSGYSTGGEIKAQLQKVGSLGQLVRAIESVCRQEQNAFAAATEHLKELQQQGEVGHEHEHQQSLLQLSSSMAGSKRSSSKRSGRDKRGSVHPSGYGAGVISDRDSANTAIAIGRRLVRTIDTWRCLLYLHYTSSKTGYEGDGDGASAGSSNSRRRQSKHEQQQAALLDSIATDGKWLVGEVRNMELLQRWEHARAMTVRALEFCKYGGLVRQAAVAAVEALALTSEELEEARGVLTSTTAAHADAEMNEAAALTRLDQASSVTAVLEAEATTLEIEQTLRQIDYSQDYGGGYGGDYEHELAGAEVAAKGARHVVKWRDQSLMQV
jgi:hypothetical protein